MGKEAEVEASFADGVDVGRLQYEAPKLIFRGRSRRVFEGAAIAGVRAEAGDLVLADGSRFRLGERAARGWADSILNPKSRLQKLGVTAGLTVGTSNLDDPNFLMELQAAGHAPTVEDGLDLLFYGADSTAELAEIGAQAARVKDRGALWIVSLKGKFARLKDTEVIAAAKRHGLVDVKVCAFSDARTALKFIRRRA